MKNLVLIGMMGSAKSSTGKKLSAMLNAPFFDGDEVYEKMYGESISDTFANLGEEVFRQRETEAYKKLGALSGAVIACGGGVVLREQNMTHLRANGVIVQLTASPEAIYERVSRNDNRPLVRQGGLENVRRIMSERKPLYDKYCDFTVDNTHLSLNKTAQKILTLYNKLK